MADRASAMPLVRVWLCGTFQVERRTEDGTWETSDKSHWEKGYARPLFKRLLCASGRRLERLTLTDDLWPDPDSPELVERYLNDAAYQLRKALRPVPILKTFGHASGYELAAQSVLWVDADACEALMKEAEQIGRTSPRAVLLLEQANAYFARGDFLEGESGLWVYARRGTLERLQYRCRIWLAEAYEQQGMVGQAEMLYSALLQDTPSDEDVLCRLMGLLYRQGMTHAALRCFEATKKHLNLLGLHLSPATDAFAKRLLSEPRPIELSSIQEYGTPKRLSSESEQQVIISSLSSSTHNMVENAAAKDEALDQLSERVTSLNTNRETLDYFEKLTETCRYLSEGNELKIAERILWTYLPRIETIAKLSFQDQQKVANIVSQGYLLAASLVGHRNDLKARHYYSEQALLYGKLAQDRNLQVAALRQLAVTFDYAERPEKVLQTYQLALPYLDEVSPLLRSCVYAALSGVSAQMGHIQETHRLIGLAYEHFPTQPENEPGFLRTINASYNTLLLWDGLNHLELGESRVAEKILAQIDTLNPTSLIPERIRIELLNYQAQVLTAVLKMEQACDYLEVALKASVTIDSRRRFQESFKVFQQVKGKWPHEQRVQDLGYLFTQHTINDAN